MRDLFRGKLVRLTSEEPAVRARVEVNWQRDTEFHHLADANPTRMDADARRRNDMNDILKGELVRLSAVDPAEFGTAFSAWNRDSEFMRLLDSGSQHLRSQKGLQKSLDEDLENQKSGRHWFAIRTLADDRLIGDIDLEVYNWTSRDAFVGLGIGEREFWGKGYGTDVMKVILLYAFTEINLQRVSLSVFEYNPRAIRCYEKVGFRHEGRQRQFLSREGKRWDLVFMGILREEWLASNH